MKITTLIPAYKTEYLIDLISSIKFQKVQTNKIIISDDSPDSKFSKLLKSDSYKQLVGDLPIEFHEGPRIGAYENFKNLIRIWNNSSELVHLMLDDDVIFPNFYERHLQAHDSQKFSCSISPRWNSNEKGTIISGQNPPIAVSSSPFRILSLDSQVMFMTTVAECRNWLGEFSNTVMNSSTCHLLLKPELGGISYAGLWDLGYFITASTHAPIAYVQDYLGYFRSGGNNNSSNNNGPYLKAAFIAYAALALGAKIENKITHQESKNCFKLIHEFISIHYASEDDMIKFRDVLMLMSDGDRNSEFVFINLWNDFLNAKSL